MNTEIEKITNTLKGVACILSSMSEVPKGSVVWNEWALQLIGKEVIQCVEELEKLK